jgi:glucose-1-phosphate cytidylyltransferase
MRDTDSIPTIILCGGRGLRIRESSSTLPKPLLPIGNRPLVWHVMKLYAAHGHADFVLALGYLAETIKEFFLHFEARTNDFRIELGAPERVEYLNPLPEAGWRVSCVDTGLSTPTGTRVRRAADFTQGQTVMVTYGDGVGDVDISALVAFHRAHGKLATITAVRPRSRFGELTVEDDGTVTCFDEKPPRRAGTVNGGFMVLEREAIERFIPLDREVALEGEPLSRLAEARQLVAYRHDGFWQQVDTPNEQQALTDLWDTGDAPWKVWE